MVKRSTRSRTLPNISPSIPQRNGGSKTTGTALFTRFTFHVNPFQVLEIIDPNTGMDTKFEAPHIWRDTIAIPPSKTTERISSRAKVKIRSRYCDFPGTFVLHCHILDHEDRGMMQEVQVLDRRRRPLQCYLMHH